MKNEHIYYSAYSCLSTLRWQGLKGACEYTNFIHNKLNGPNFRWLVSPLKTKTFTDKIRVESILKLTDYNLQDFVCPLHMQGFEQDYYFKSNHIISLAFYCVCMSAPTNFLFLFSLILFSFPLSLDRWWTHTNTHINTHGERERERC